MQPTQRIDCFRRYAWAVGVADGVLAIVLANTVFSILGTSSFWAIPMEFALPIAALVAWRGGRYVLSLLRPKSVKSNLVAEGFVCMSLFIAWDLAPGFVVALRDGHDVSWLGLGIYLAVGGLFGAAIAAAIATVDLLLVETLSPINYPGRAD